MTNPTQNRIIHSLIASAGMSDAEYRGLLQARFGVGSSKDLDERQARALIDDLYRHAPQVLKAKRASGKYASVLQALWIAGYHLGIIRDRRDAAMLAFVARQTGLAHTQFLIEHQSAVKAIEALKDWLAREGGVYWPKDGDAYARKWAVIDALALKLGEEGRDLRAAARLETLDATMKTMGERLRAKSKKRRAS